MRAENKLYCDIIKIKAENAHPIDKNHIINQFEFFVTLTEYLSRRVYKEYSKNIISDIMNKVLLELEEIMIQIRVPSRVPYMVCDKELYFIMKNSKIIFGEDIPNFSISNFIKRVMPFIINEFNEGNTKETLVDELLKYYDETNHIEVTLEPYDFYKDFLNSSNTVNEKINLNFFPFNLIYQFSKYTVAQVAEEVK